MVRMMHTAQGEPADERVLKHIKGKVTQLMNVLDGDGDGDISFDEFMRANRKIGQLMYPRVQREAVGDEAEPPPPFARAGTPRSTCSSSCAAGA